MEILELIELAVENPWTATAIIAIVVISFALFHLHGDVDSGYWSGADGFDGGDD